MPQQDENDRSEIEFSSKNHELIIRNRYKFYYNINDVLIAVWFILGSVLFFWKETETIAIWFFLFGSIELLVRPLMRIFREIHLKKIRSGKAGSDDNIGQ
ncbi:YrhK family protein [Planococcus sp. CP5-4]|uniref:YrhK family protein n=1 Tax=unclassified Planococcus (in: firmicutes) TaxID=2662419 RepID=UPI001C2193DE|nr:MULTISPECIES: YrhK family protein [unclassified Planococcus (in: firmicutes)]MBU9673920.1 YrhK family protein [Planococcus sp. CP5-4_YE]MBV0909790.1 YrhK family protein [Planococcus sp. CP5-4_UN]MBW6065274.1 YrhK family protein [Planococcus sp. CP5-4]